MWQHIFFSLFIFSVLFRLVSFHISCIQYLVRLFYCSFQLGSYFLFYVLIILTFSLISEIVFFFTLHLTRYTYKLSLRFFRASNHSRSYLHLSFPLILYLVFLFFSLNRSTIFLISTSLFD